MRPNIVHNQWVVGPNPTVGSSDFEGLAVLFGQLFLDRTSRFTRAISAGNEPDRESNI